MGADACDTVFSHKVLTGKLIGSGAQGPCSISFSSCMEIGDTKDGRNAKKPCSLRGSGEKNPGSSVIVAAVCSIVSPVELKIDIKSLGKKS